MFRKTDAINRLRKSTLWRGLPISVVPDMTQKLCNKRYWNNTRSMPSSVYGSNSVKSIWTCDVLYATYANISQPSISTAFLCWRNTFANETWHYIHNSIFYHNLDNIPASRNHFWKKLYNGDTIANLAWHKGAHSFTSHAVDNPFKDESFAVICLCWNW